MVIKALLRVVVVGGLSACASSPEPAPREGVLAAARSIPGYVLRCPDADNPCIVPVKVRASVPADLTTKRCIAKIDFETVRLRDDTRLFFQLVNIDPNARLDHEFDDTNNSGGLRFTGSAPRKSQLKHRRFYLGKTVSEWRGGPDATAAAGLDYVPLVKLSTGEPCEGADPKIANDG